MVPGRVDMETDDLSRIVNPKWHLTRHNRNGDAE
jgi:hypothetical protein